MKNPLGPFAGESGLALKLARTHGIAAFQKYVDFTVLAHRFTSVQAVGKEDYSDVSV